MMTLKGFFLLAALAPWLLGSAWGEENGDLRLAGYGASSLAGRLEVAWNGDWGTVCGTRFENHAAGVACRQLGLGHAVSYSTTPAIRYGPGTGAVLLEEVICHGNESHLLRCIHSGLDTPTSCQHDSDVSIACSNVTTPYSGQVRLSRESPSQLGSPSHSNSLGRVEFYFRRQWGPLCSDGLGENKANSICRQLGYTNAASFRSVSSDGPFWIVPTTSCSTPQPCFTDCLDTLPVAMESTCPSNAIMEVQCAFNLSLADSKSSGSPDLCTRPTDPSSPEPGAVRLVDPGLVEIFLNGDWGTVCDTVFGYPEADVVCKELGYPGALRFYTDSLLGNGSGTIYTFNCSGIESQLMECSAATIASSNLQCSHDDDVGVECSPVVPPYGSLALRESAGSAGRLLIFTGEVFQPICDASFTLEDAHVACRQLGYAGASSVVGNNYYGLAESVSDRLYGNVFHCSGSEDHLLSCDTARVGAGLCRDEYDAVGIRCASVSSNSDEGSLRLVGGASAPPAAGRLEIFLEGEWGSVCGAEFDHLAAHVACQQLDYGTAVSVAPGSFGSGSGPAHLTSVRCQGSEQTLLECAHRVGDGGEGCSGQTDVGLECGPASVMDGELRVANGNESAGRLEVGYHGVWMSVCGRFFSDKAADVACRQLGAQTGLGFDHAAEYCTDASCFGESDGFIHVADYQCRGNEQSLQDCQIEIYSSTLCDHAADVGIFCAVSPSPPSSRLPSLPRTTASGRPKATPTPVESSDPGVNGKDPTPFFVQASFYVLVGVGGVVLLALIFAVTLCCFCAIKKKQLSWPSTRPRVAAVNAGNDLARGRDPIASELAANPVKEDFAEDYDDPSLTVEGETIDPSAVTKFPHGASNSIPTEPPPNYDELDFLPPQENSYGSETKTGEL